MGNQHVGVTAIDFRKKIEDEKIYPNENTQGGYVVGYSIAIELVEALELKDKEMEDILHADKTDLCRIIRNRDKKIQELMDYQKSLEEYIDVLEEGR